MKKALKISAYCLLVSVIIALGLCYIIIPERTKCAMDIVISYLNTPLGIIGGTTLTLGYVVYIVFKIVSIARKTSIEKDIELIDKKINELKSKEESVKLREIEIKALLSNYSSRIDSLSDLLVKACETSPNAKIKAIAQDICETESQIKQDLSSKQDLIEKYSDKKLSDLFDKVDELEKVVKTYGERKETTHD